MTKTTNKTNVISIIEYKCQIQMSTLIGFFEQHPVFTQDEYRKFLLSQGTTNHNTQRELLAYHLKKQHIIRIRRGLFASIPATFRDVAEEFPVDSYLLAGRITQDAVIAYHSAFDLHGVSYSLHHQCLYLSEQLIRPFKFNETDFIRLPFPNSLLEQNATQMDVISIDRQGLNVKVTSLERTLVDVLDRPNYGGGWEEIWKTADHISILNLDKVINYVQLLNNATTTAKLGFFLEHFKQQFGAEESSLKVLEAQKPSGVHYLKRGKRESGKLLKRWNLVVPTYILDHSWDENEDV